MISAIILIYYVLINMLNTYVFFKVSKAVIPLDT